MGEGKFSALQLEYSTICNMKNICRHCYGSTGILSGEQTINDQMLTCILKEAREIAESITITGGEPACFPDIVRKITRESDLPITVMTNGLAFITGIQPSLVLFSLDAPDVRPVADIRPILRNVLRYTSNLSCNTVLSPGLNLFEYYALLKKMQKVLVSNGKELLEWKLGFVINKGKAVSNQDIVPHFDEVFPKLREFIKVYLEEQPFPLAIRGILYTKFMDPEHLDSMKNFSLHLESNPCLDCFGRGEIITVNAEGHVQLCTTCRDVSVPIGDSLLQAVDTLLSKDELVSYTYPYWLDCVNCRYLQLCGCGCPSLAQTYGGTWFSKDPFQCTVMKYWEEYILPILPDNIRTIYQDMLGK